MAGAPALACARTSRSEEISRSANLLPLIYFALPLLFLSLVPIKSWLYITPVFPPLAMMCGRLWSELARGGLRESRFIRRFMAAASVLLGCLAVVMLAGAAVLMIPGGLSAVAGPEGLIRTGVPVVLPRELEAIAQGGVAGLIIFVVLAVAAAWASVTMFRRRFRTALAALLAVSSLGMLYDDVLVEPPTALMNSQRAFARRVNERLKGEAGPAEVPLYVCAGECYELMFYLDGRFRVVRGADADAFLDRIRPPDSPHAGTPVRLILSRDRFDRTAARTGPLPELLATSAGESRRVPLVLTAVKLAEATGAESAAAAHGSP